MHSLDSCDLRFDLQVYRLTAIKKALYKFGDRCSSQIRLSEINEAVVTLAFAATTNVQLLVADIQNEVLDQDLRETISEETAAVRSLLLAQAFSQTSLIDPAGEAGDYHLDPLEVRKRS